MEVGCQGVVYWEEVSTAVICLHLEWSFSGEFLAKHVITGLVWVYHLSVSSSVTLKHTLPASTSGFQTATTPLPIQRMRYQQIHLCLLRGYTMQVQSPWPKLAWCWTCETCTSFCVPPRLPLYICHVLLKWVAPANRVNVTYTLGIGCGSLCSWVVWGQRKSQNLTAPTSTPWGWVLNLRDDIHLFLQVPHWLLVEAVSGCFMGCRLLVMQNDYHVFAIWQNIKCLVRWTIENSTGFSQFRLPDTLPSGCPLTMKSYR